MSKLKLVSQLFPDVPHMTAEQANLMRDIIAAEGAHDVLELGFYKGKSSAYIAAISKRAVPSLFAEPLEATQVTEDDAPQTDG